MEVESSLKHKADSLQALLSGPIAASDARLAGRSRGIPSGEELHFYDNFDEFKAPAREIAAKSVSSLKGVAASGPIWGRNKKPPPPPFPDDLDEAFDWIVDFNDEFVERFGISMEEFKRLREKEEESGGKIISSMDLDSGFQMVYGKKKKESMRESGKEGGLTSNAVAGVTFSSRDSKTTARRSRVPFHIPSIPRPQDQYHIRVNNNNQPFEHVWLERSEDGSRFVHPLEKLSMLDFVDRNVAEGELVKLLSIESTPFKLVEGVNELKGLAAKLRGVNEFAVDLEHNQYRSFQGLTCLMQISTRTEDFVIDTLKLRIHVGPYLREIFNDPSKRKVMHGADRDILWLQRDFGIYVCNLFDTGQASRVMQLERNSLEYLLLYFCGVNANKEYQHADWRLRPLPDEMLKYAREDTHYLLHIYDLMKNRLISASTDENDLLLEVYDRSNVICMQLYEKELLTDASYLHIYGLQEADFNSNQLAVVYGLCQWRDNIAREEDESTGYILPNKALLEIAREMPMTPGKLHQLVKFRHPFVEHHLRSVVSIIRSSVENSAAFESIAAQLKGQRLEASPMQDTAVSHNSGLVTATEYLMASAVGEDHSDGTRKICTMQSAELPAASTATMDDCAKPADTGHFSSPISAVSKCQQEEKLDNMRVSEIGYSLKLPDTAGTMQSMDNESTEPVQLASKVGIVSAPILKKPTCALGALLGNSSSSRKFNADKGGSIEQVKNKVEQIKSTVSLPFHYFSGGTKLPEVCPEVNLNHPQVENQQRCSSNITQTVKSEEVIHLENEPHNSESSTAGSPEADDSMKHRKWLPLPEICSDGGLHSESDIAEELVSTSGFEKCFRSINERRSSHQNQKPSQALNVNYQLKPFEHATARKNTKFGEVEEKDRADGDDGLRILPDS